MSISSKIWATSASPDAKNASRSASDIRSRRKRSSVRTAKNGSCSPSTFQSSAERSRISANDLRQLAQIANRRVRHDVQSVIERRRDGGAAGWRIEVDAGDAEPLGAVNVD